MEDKTKTQNKTEDASSLSLKELLELRDYKFGSESINNLIKQVKSIEGYDSLSTAREKLRQKLIHNESIMNYLDSGSTKLDMYKKNTIIQELQKLVDVEKKYLNNIFDNVDKNIKLSFTEKIKLLYYDLTGNKKTKEKLKEDIKKNYILNKLIEKKELFKKQTKEIITKKKSLEEQLNLIKAGYKTEKRNYLKLVHSVHEYVDIKDNLVVEYNELISKKENAKTEEEILKINKSINSLKSDITKIQRTIKASTKELNYSLGVLNEYSNDIKYYTEQKNSYELLNTEANLNIKTMNKLISRMQKNINISDLKNSFYNILKQKENLANYTIQKSKEFEKGIVNINKLFEKDNGLVTMLDINQGEFLETESLNIKDKLALYDKFAEQLDEFGDFDD